MSNNFKKGQKKMGQFIFDEERLPEELLKCKKQHNEYKYKRYKH
jgi:hypothetical protein